MCRDIPVIPWPSACVRACELESGICNKVREHVCECGVTAGNKQEVTKPMAEHSVMDRKEAARWTPVASRETRAPRAWPLFMTARVAADYCDTSPWTIRRHVEPCARRGRNFIYSIESVEAWMRGDAATLRPNVHAQVETPHGEGERIAHTTPGSGKG